MNWKDILKEDFYDEIDARIDEAHGDRNIETLVAELIEMQADGDYNFNSNNEDDIRRVLDEIKDDSNKFTIWDREADDYVTLNEYIRFVSGRNPMDDLISELIHEI